MSKDNGGAAFASNAVCTDGHVLQEGMSLRDWFAGQALQGALSKYGFGDMEKHGEDACINACAKNAYLLADAMIEARKS